MTQILKRALPFVIAFVLGVGITFILGGGSRKRFTTFTDTGCSRGPRSQMVEVWELPDTATVIRTRTWPSKSFSTSLTLKEQALVARAERSGTNFVVSYVSPETIDGRGYTQNVGISNIPRPAFWYGRQDAEETRHCNTLVRVELDASGTVRRAEPVNGYGAECAYLTDILDAAKQISFRPALRDGAPVTVRMSLMYKAR